MEPRENPRLPDDLPLEGVTVLDFTRVLSGPYCTRLLADLGARVVKVERPGEGDEVRYAGRQMQAGRADQSAYFARMNAGKASIAIDFAREDARDVILDLVREADVVVENFSPGVMQRHRLGYDDLAGVRPGLVYCSISGFGQTGPLRSMQAYAHLVNAFSGMMELERGGDAPPRASNLQAADVLAGLNASAAICAALLRQARTGRGAHVDVSMLESLVCADDVNFQAILNGGIAERRARPGMFVGLAGGRHIALQLGGAPQMWPRLAALIGHPELVDDPRFATGPDRRLNWEALRELIAGWLEGVGSVDEAARLLSQARVPHAPMLAPEELARHPHLAIRGAFPDIAHPGGGTVRVTAQPFQLDGAPVLPAGPPPHRIGEQTREVLANVLGYDAGKIESLVARGIVSPP